MGKGSPRRLPALAPPRRPAASLLFPSQVNARIHGVDPRRYVLDLDGLYVGTGHAMEQRLFLAEDTAFTVESFDQAAPISGCPCASEDCDHRDIFERLALGSAARRLHLILEVPPIPVTRAVYAELEDEVVLTIITVERSGGGAYVSLRFAASDGDEIDHLTLIHETTGVCGLCRSTVCLHALLAADRRQTQLGAAGQHGALALASSVSALVPLAPRGHGLAARIKDTRISVAVASSSARYQMSYLMDRSHGSTRDRAEQPEAYDRIYITRRGQRLLCERHGTGHCVDIHMLDSVLEMYGQPRI